MREREGERERVVRTYIGVTAIRTRVGVVPVVRDRQTDIITLDL